MLSTVRIVSGSAGTPWSPDQRRCVLEIRSEHKLNDPTTFSILMHDIPDRRGERHRALSEGHLVAVLVRPQNQGEWHVLFQGKVTEIKETHTQGGVGSTILFRGKDIRMNLAGYSHRGAWSGQVDAVMRTLIEEAFSTHNVVAPADNTLDEEENPLGQNTNNLDFLRAQAIAYGHNFWVSYARVPEATPGLGALNPADSSPPGVTIEPTINWAPSPYLTAGGTGGAQALPVVGGGGDGPIPFRVHVNRNACPNVTAFEVVSEATEVRTMPDQSGDQTALGPPAPPSDPAEPAPGADDPNVHFVAPVVEPRGEDTPVNALLERERAFDRKVELSTTKAMLRRICIPNDLATLEGVPEAVSGIRFRISEATHVIRIDGHWIDAVLESNGEPAGGATGDIDEPAAGAAGAAQ